jgi:hypothetical protein
MVAKLKRPGKHFRQLFHALNILLLEGFRGEALCFAESQDRLIRSSLHCGKIETHLKSTAKIEADLNAA